MFDYLSWFAVWLFMGFVICLIRLFWLVGVAIGLVSFCAEF